MQPPRTSPTLRLPIESLEERHLFFVAGQVNASSVSYRPDQGMAPNPFTHVATGRASLNPPLQPPSTDTLSPLLRLSVIGSDVVWLRIKPQQVAAAIRNQLTDVQALLQAVEEQLIRPQSQR